MEEPASLETKLDENVLEKEDREDEDIKENIDNIEVQKLYLMGPEKSILEDAFPLINKMKIDLKSDDTSYQLCQRKFLR